VTGRATAEGGSLAGSPAWPPLSEDSRFDEAWQVELVAVAMLLAESGRFSPAAWAEALGAAIRAAQADGDPDLGGTYYDHCLRALESLCAAKGLLTTSAVNERTEAWRDAYHHTPHGQPVELPY
jgi:nitrile hydratase accessory protein